MDKRNRKKKTVADTVCEIHKFIGYAVLSNCFVRSTKLGCGFQEVITMMDSITVGAKIRMTEAVTGDHPVGSTVTILYIDEMDNVFIEWSDGKLSSFSDKQVLHSFEKIA